MVEISEAAMITYAVGFVLWIIIFIMVLRNEFHNPKVKIAWIIAFLFFPPSALLFPFLGMKHMK